MSAPILDYLSEAQKVEVRDIYNRGVPFFTKSAIKRLKDQIDSVISMVKNGSSVDDLKFVATSIMGQPVEKPIPPGVKGLTREIPERTMYGPYLSYTTYQGLIHSLNLSNLCSLSICYHITDSGVHRCLTDTRNAFETYRQRWESSKTCLSIKTSMRTDAPALPQITKIIAFACSSMSCTHDEAVSSRVATQHALILTLRDIVEAAQPGSQIKCIAQDPCYSDVDKELLSELGVTVVEDPQGFLEVDDHSIVLSFAPNIPVRQVVTDLARPVVLAWNTVLTEEETMSRWKMIRKPISGWEHLYRPSMDPGSVEELEAAICDPESSRVRGMIREEYDNVGDLDKEAFGDANIYLRREGRRK